jgi:putative transposase
MIKLPKAGLVKAVIHRDAPDSWKLKNATVSRDPDGRYYCSVTYEYEADITPVPVSENAIGFDYKSDGMYMDSEGNVGAEHKYYRESQKKLAHEQKKLSRKQKDSNNYKKQKRRVAKAHKHIANQRMDSRQKASTAIANRYDVACAEDIDLKAISNRKFHNGKSTMDNAYGEFLRMLEYKMKDRGKYFVRVNKWYPSSQICSRCGKRHKIPLSVRVYECECGLVMNRDHNAALNIKKEGLRILMETL